MYITPEQIFIQKNKRKRIIAVTEKLISVGIIFPGYFLIVNKLLIKLWAKQKWKPNSVFVCLAQL